MALRTGTYNAARPVWRGILREDSAPAYVCEHSGHGVREAKECARQALAQVKATNTLPDGWLSFRSAVDALLINADGTVR